MILECANGTFCLIAAIHVWRDKLEGGVPFEGDCFLLAQDLEINKEPQGHQMHHNGVICCNAVAVALGFEGLLENEVAVSIEGNMIYWLPKRALMGKRPVLLVKSLLSSFVTTNTWLEGASTGGGRTPVKLAWFYSTGHFGIAGQDGP